jgi:hypothetical protein
MNTALGIGLFIVLGSAIQITRIMKRSVIIRKTDFRKIENRIREDERKKVLQDVRKA